MTLWKNLVVALVAAFALVACSSSNDTAAPMPTPEPMPSAYEMAKEAIAAAETVAAANEAYEDASQDTGVSAPQLASLREARDARVNALEMAAAAAVRKGLEDAAMCTAATAECLAAHDALIAALQGDVNALAEDGDATNAQQTAAQTALREAQEAREAVNMAIADLDRTTETGMKVGDAIDKANELEEDRSADAITAAKVAIKVAEEAIGEDDDSYDERIMMAKNAVARAEERNAVDMAIMDARTAIEGLAADADADAVAAVQTQLTAAKMAVDENEHLTDAEEAGHTETIALLQVTVTHAQARVEADAEKERMAEEEAEKTRNEANAAMAAKLYAGIGSAPLMSTGDGQRTATYTGTNHADITLTIDDAAPGDGTDTTAVLTEDKDTSVAANHGWEGKRYTLTMPASGGEYEAYVYSNVEEPTMGKKFGDDEENEEFQYLLTEGALPAEQIRPERVALPGVTRTAGTETFDLPDPNPSGETIVNVQGSYHGVSGTYSCVAGNDSCTATVAASGFTLAGGGTWTFTPSSANARVMDAADTTYASYGWWLHKAANDGAFTASAFVDYKGGNGTAELSGSIINGLDGTATYRGGAAGKYALASSTGGTNDAGHFTARATLEADFTNNTAETAITGAIDMFIGADGQSRNWEVELSGSPITDSGSFGVATDRATWTIDGTAATASGNWSGQLYDTGDDGVPQTATGTFYSEYGTAGRMVGAFGTTAD